MRPSTSAIQQDQLTSLYQQGQLKEARQLAEQLLQADPNNSQLLEIAAASALQTGDLQLAIKRFNQQVLITPENALAHSNLCMALHMDGQRDLAYQHGQQAILLDPRLADAWNNLGNLYEAGNNLTKAREHYDMSLTLDDSDPLTHLNAGAIALRLGDYPAAESHFRNALDRQPGYAQAHNNLAATLVKLERFDEADKAYQQAIQLEPHNPEFLTNHAVYLLGRDETARAHALLDKALKMDPNHIGANITLGNLSEEQNDTDAMSRYYNKVLAQDPENSTVLCNMGYREFELGNLQNAIDYLNRALDSNPYSAKTLAGLGKTLLRQERTDEAAVLINKAQALSPNEAHTYIAKAWLHEQTGEFDEAKSDWERVIQQHPEMSEGYIGLATLYENTGEPDLARNLYRSTETSGAITSNAIRVKLYHCWSALEEQHHQLDTAAALAAKAAELDPDYTGLPLMQAKLARRNGDYAAALACLDQLDIDSVENKQSYINFQFERGDILDRLKKYTAAFVSYDAANQAKNVFIGNTYDAEEDALRFSKLKKAFSKASISSFSQSSESTASDAPVPVFIIGFPRSGTSLLEQILGSHPQIAPAGELTQLSELADGKATELLASDLPYPELLLDKSVISNDSRISRLRDFYLGKLSSLQVTTDTSGWITDKMPHNALHLGMIRLLFPESPVIHIARHPLNACLSAYFTNFRTGQRYTSSMTDTAQHYKQVLDMVQHYQTNGISLLDIRYEDLVMDQQAVVQRVLDYIGAPWDDACLQHHKSERVVKTASYEQVTQKVYTTSLYRYRNYREAVQPIIPILQSTIKRLGYTLD